MSHARWLGPEVGSSVPLETPLYERGLRQGIPVPDDPVNHPLHYTHGGIETIDGIRAALGQMGTVAYCRGNALKYLWRCGLKGAQEEDLQKARWYIDYALQVLGEGP